MRIADVQEMLGFIAALDRRPFPPGAVEAWHSVLRGVDTQDARTAVEEHARLSERPEWTPGVIYRRAKAIATVREAANRHQIEAGRHGTEPSAAYLEFRRQLATTASQLGDLNRRVRKAPMDSPTVDAERAAAMERARAAQLAALAARDAA